MVPFHGGIALSVLFILPAVSRKQNPGICLHWKIIITKIKQGSCFRAPAAAVQRKRLDLLWTNNTHSLTDVSHRHNKNSANNVRQNYPVESANLWRAAVLLVHMQKLPCRSHKHQAESQKYIFLQSSHTDGVTAETVHNDWTTAVFLLCLILTGKYQVLLSFQSHERCDNTIYYTV